MSAISASAGTLAAPVSVTGHPSGAFSRQSSRTYPADCRSAVAVLSVLTNDKHVSVINASAESSWMKMLRALIEDL
jgi:hypothetical protein